MVDRRIRSLIVRFSESPPVYGVITARDVVNKVLSKSKSPAEVTVSEIASKPLFCVERDESMLRAAQIMQDNNVARIFICEDGKPIGVVSMIDIMSATLIMRARGEHAD
jgi:signal-transduction protein with cAMP-binding, CBS, and nucleotidyltransferase domain